ncbi:hypothetical protein PALB_25620 [Pseudoalteromonas luteoviolacea B = ATCC 29581]|nr:hypothetical protein PALB_25620 [Pseudoalteromonas luteoviolacea B = ATCC 29581]
MAGTTMIFLIATIAIVFGVVSSMFNRFIEFKRESQQENDQNRHLTKEIQALKQRIEVLEQIVTDESYNVKQQFKNL